MTHSSEHDLYPPMGSIFGLGRLTPGDVIFMFVPDGQFPLAVSFAALWHLAKGELRSRSFDGPSGSGGWSEGRSRVCAWHAYWDTSRIRPTRLIACCLFRSKRTPAFYSESLQI